MTTINYDNYYRHCDQTWIEEYQAEKGCSTCPLCDAELMPFLSMAYDKNNHSVKDSIKVKD